MYLYISHENVRQESWWGEGRVYGGASVGFMVV